MQKLNRLITRYNKDAYGNPISIHTVMKHNIPVDNPKLQLDYIPDERLGVRILEPQGFYQVYNLDEIAENSFYLDGDLLRFHHSKCGVEILVDYYDIGISLIGIERIYTAIDSKGNVVQTLNDIITDSKFVFDTLSTMGDVIVVVEELKEYVALGNDVYDRLGIIITKAEKTIADLTAKNTEAQKTLSDLTAKNTESQATLRDLTAKNTESQTTLRNLTAKNTEALDTKDKLTVSDNKAKETKVAIDTSITKGEEVLGGLHNHEISNIKRFKPVPNDDVIASFEPDFCKSLRFKLRGVVTKPCKNDLIFYKDNFTEFVNKAGSELAQIINVEGIEGNWSVDSQGLFCSRETYGDTESLMKFFINPKFSNFRISVKFKGLNNYSSARCGLSKDENNWILANIDCIYNKSELLVKSNGVLQSFSGVNMPSDWNNIEDKTLHLFCFNNVCIVILECNNRYHLVVEKNIVGILDITNSEILSEFNLSIGTRIKKDKDGLSTLRISEVEAGYTGGLNVGADFKPITYEDGCVIKKDSSIFFTSTTHLTSDISGNGTSIYSMNLDTYDVNLVSKICGKINNKLISCGASKVFYDRNKLEWVVISTNFNEHPTKSYIGISDKNLLSGVHIVDMNNLNIPNSNQGTWDVDCVYIDNTYILIYTSNGDLRKIVKASSSDLLNWTLDKQIDSTQFGEGSVITKIGGRYIITHVANKNGLEMRDLYTLDLIDNIKCNIWSGNQYTPNTPMPWGCIMPIVYKNRTEYRLLTFSMRTFLNRTYGYGDLWIYDCDVINPKQEFKQFDMKYFD